MTTSQNGWPVLTSDKLRRWVVPGVDVVLPLVPGAGGFLLVHNALWFSEIIETLDNRPADDWGWASRNIRGSSEVSNHASGTATDLNATKHPMGVPTLETFTRDQVGIIHRRLARRYQGLIRWGGDYENRPDAMHWELCGTRKQVVALSAQLQDTPRGRRVRAANPKGKVP